MKGEFIPNHELSKNFILEYTLIKDPNSTKYISLIDEISNIAIDGFGAVFASPDVIRQMLVKESHVFCARSKLSGQMLGFQLTMLFEVLGKRTIYYSRVMSKSSQGNSIGKHILLHSIDKLQAEMICARTQNPAALLSIQHTIKTLNPKAFFPFSKGNITREEIALILEQIELQTQDTVATVDTVTGVQKNAFSQKLGDYEIKFNNPEIASINEFLIQNGLNRDRGDAQYYFAIIPSQ